MMFIFNLILFLTIACGTALANHKSSTLLNPLEERLLDFLEKWRIGSSGILDSTMPSLDMIKIPPLEGQFQDNGVKLSYSTSDMILKGLNTFSVEDISASLDLRNADMEVLLEQLVLTSDHYDLSGSAYILYPLKGSGKLTVEVQDTLLTASVQLDSNETSTWVEKVALDFHVGGIQVDLAGSTWPINSVLNKQGLNILDKYHDYLVSTAQDCFTWYANEYLANVSVTQLLHPLTPSNK